MTEWDLANLRQRGYDNRAILDAAQVVSYSNYINRIANAPDIELEDFIRP